MDGVPENLEFGCLIEFATICHKYDYVKAVTHFSFCGYGLTLDIIVLKI